MTPEQLEKFIKGLLYWGAVASIGGFIGASIGSRLFLLRTRFAICAKLEDSSSYKVRNKGRNPS